MLNFSELLGEYLVQNIFSYYTELSLLLCSYSVKKVVACFLWFLGPVFIPFLSGPFFFLPLCYLYYAQFLIPSQELFPGVVEEKPEGSVWWVHRLLQPFLRTSCTDPTLMWTDPSRLSYCPQVWPILLPSDYLLDLWGFFYSRSVNCPGASLSFLLLWRWYYAGLVALGGLSPLACMLGFCGYLVF